VRLKGKINSTKGLEKIKRTRTRLKNIINHKFRLNDEIKNQ
jgi:hypothetical protein